MNTLVIYTHPSKNSLNGSFLESTLKGLKGNKSVKNIEVLDLYEENFDPILKYNVRFLSCRTQKKYSPVDPGVSNQNYFCWIELVVLNRLE